MVLAVVVLLAVAFQAPADEVSGTWKAVFVGPLGERPKMVSEMVFEFEVEGNELTGMAHMGHWPGDAPISEGKVDGNRISFSVIGKLPWWSSSPKRSGSGYPNLKFTGTLRGGKMQLSLDWGSIVDGEAVSGASWPAAGFARPLEMEGEKVSN